MDGAGKLQSTDVFRDTSLRYLGYFGLLGRVFAPFIPGNIAKSTAISYFVSDVIDKSQKSVIEQKSKYRLFVNASDAIIWQATSSFLIPSLLLKSISEHARKLKVKTNLPVFRSSALPYILTFTLMSFLSHPIDKGVNYVMDNSYRKWFKSDCKICDNLLGPMKGHTLSKTPQNIYNHGDFDQIYEEIKSRNSNNQSEKSAKPTKSKNKRSDKQSKNQRDKQSDKPTKKQSVGQKNKPSNKNSPEK